MKVEFKKICTRANLYINIYKLRLIRHAHKNHFWVKKICIFKNGMTY